MRIVQSVYSPELTLLESKCYYVYVQFLYYYYFYYEPVQINVVQSGTYTLSSIGNRFGGLMGYLYKEHVNEFIPSKRLIDFNHNGCSDTEFKIIAELQSSETYILIIAPFVAPWRPKFSILAYGPNNITFNPISKFHIESIISSFNRDFH